MLVLKVAAIAVTGVILAGFLKNIGSPLWTVLVMAVSLVILAYMVVRLEGVIKQLNYIKQFIPVDGGYLAILFKIVGITYVAQFAADICKDNGNTAVAGQIELFCRVSIAALSMPLIILLFETVMAWM